MAGLDTITARILEEARQRAETVLGEARAEAEQLRARSRTQTEKECREKKERGDARVQELLERGRSAAELEKRRRILEGICISGGEPTLHRELPELLETIRSYGYAIKLDTNGYRPDVIRRLQGERLLDYIA